MAFVLHGTQPYPFPELRYFPTMPVATDNPVTVEGVELGRMLFHDPILSADSSRSCASCHQQRYAFSDGPLRYSKATDGSELPRHTPALFNLAWYPAFFWDGRAVTLEDQVLHPVRDPMELGAGWPMALQRIRTAERYAAPFKRAFGDQAMDSVLVARAIAQYLRSLISANSKYDRVLRGEDLFTADEYAGFVLANEQNKGDCLQCHITDQHALGTAMRFSNNGLDTPDPSDRFTDPGRHAITGSEKDLGVFKIPSLRNVALTAPYMHDGRFSSLEEVVEFYSNAVHASAYTDPRMGTARRGGAHLNDREQKQLIAFLHTLTDSSFVVDPKHGDPF